MDYNPASSLDGKICSESIDNEKRAQQDALDDNEIELAERNIGRRFTEDELRTFEESRDLRRNANHNDSDADMEDNGSDSDTDMKDNDSDNGGDNNNNGGDNNNNGGDNNNSGGNGGDNGDDNGGSEDFMIPLVFINFPIVTVLLNLYRFVKLDPTCSVYFNVYLIKAKNNLNKFSLKLINIFNFKILTYLSCIFIIFVLYIVFINEINLLCDAPRA
jgi:hypothetical protein